LSVVASRFLPSTEIIATDYHPGVLANLRSNVSTNVFGQDRSPISVRALDWANPSTEDLFSEGSFDIIVAADEVCHPDHARWIKFWVQRYPRHNQHHKLYIPVFWLITSLRSRGRHERMDATVEQVLPALDPSSGEESW
jgi:predicted nicotinamide N-methyase